MNLGKVRLRPLPGTNLVWPVLKSVKFGALVTCLLQVLKMAILWAARWLCFSPRSTVSALWVVLGSSVPSRADPFMLEPL